MSLCALCDTSPEFQKAHDLLSHGWKGTYGELCKEVKRTTRSALLAWRFAESFLARHPNWDRTSVHKAK